MVDTGRRLAVQVTCEACREHIELQPEHTDGELRDLLRPFLEQHPGPYVLEPVR